MNKYTGPGDREENRMENKRSQYTVLRNNCADILSHIEGVMKDDDILKEIYLLLTKRFHAATQGRNHRVFSNLQIDFGAFILLRDNGFNFTTYQGDTSDLYTVAQNFRKESGTNNPNEIDLVFPSFVKDALIAIEENGAEPPADEMQRASDYFADKILNAQVINFYGSFDEPTEKEFYDFIDRLREAVGNDDELNGEIDEVMKLKDSFGSKIVSLQNSKKLKPYINQN